MDALEQLKKRQAEDQRSAEAEQAAKIAEQQTQQEFKEANALREIQAAIEKLEQLSCRTGLSLSENGRLFDFSDYRDSSDSLAGFLANASFSSSAWANIEPASLSDLQISFANWDSWYTILYQDRELANKLLKAGRNAYQHSRMLDKKYNHLAVFSTLGIIAGAVLGIVLHNLVPAITIALACMVVLAVRFKRHHYTGENPHLALPMLLILLSIIYGFVFWQFSIFLIGSIASIVYGILLSAFVNKNILGRKYKA